MPRATVLTCGIDLTSPGTEETAGARTMRSSLVLTGVVALSLVSCTTVRVTGMVYDRTTSDGIGSCGITSGPKYYHTDSAGHYDLKFKADWKTITLVAPGYHSQTITVDTSH